MTKEELTDLVKRVGGTDNYRQFLCELAKEMKAELVVECGTYMGLTAKAIAEANPTCKVLTMDVWSESGDYVKDAPHNVKYLYKDGIEVGKTWTGPKVDILFIDVEHTYECTIGNYNAWEDHVREGGVILFDDTEFTEMAKVKEELKDELIILNELHWSGFSAIIKI
jgi:predicted O-methyltransferase YrrM